MLGGRALGAGGRPRTVGGAPRRYFLNVGVGRYATIRNINTRPVVEHSTNKYQISGALDHPLDDVPMRPTSTGGHMPSDWVPTPARSSGWGITVHPVPPDDGTGWGDAAPPTEGLGRIVEWIVGGQTPRAWKVIPLR
eukprot:COSAG02_NODE_428_length_22489_cov_4.690219_2_plen_137_part_00